MRAVDKSDDAMLKIMKAFEFGQNEAVRPGPGPGPAPVPSDPLAQDERKPWVAMVTSGALFFAGPCGAAPP